VLGVSIDHLVGEGVLGMDGVVVFLSARNAGRVLVQKRRVMREFVLLLDLLKSPLPIGVALVKVLARCFAKIGGEELRDHQRERERQRGRERDRETETQRGEERERQRERERDRERQRETE
jgi:hypothetical protein